jgi:tripartite-type tricarboxylate transporter receptor subunit TctC
MIVGKLIWMMVVMAMVSTTAWSQEFPVRAITIVVPFGAGTAADLPARALGKVVGQKLGQPVIIENRTGAGGIIAAESVARATPDGYTLLLGSNGSLVTFPFLFKKLGYDPRSSFVPVHGVIDTAFVMAVRRTDLYETLPQFIEYAKKNPDKLNFYSIGRGSLQHLATELFMREAGIKMTHVLYRTSSAATTDLLSGRIDVMIDSYLTLGALIETEKLRALGVTDTKRMRSLPDVKTFSEQGYPGVVNRAWAVAVAPRDTPPAIVERLSKVMNESLKDPTVSSFIEEQGANVMFDMDKDQLARFLAAETLKTRELVERAGILPE